jgi:hypothetical protein
MNSFSKWDRDAYRARVGGAEASRRRAAISALGGKLKLIGDIGGHLLTMPANPAA